jgi:hypothetical protein
MPIQVKSIHVIGVCLVVLFGFILNNEVDARSFAREDRTAALENKRQEQSALRKRAFRLRSNDDEGDRKYEQAVRAVLAYAQYELKQRKRDDGDNVWTESGSISTSGGPPPDAPSNLWTEVGSNDNSGGSPPEAPSNLWTEVGSNDNSGGSPPEAPSNLWTEVATSDSGSGTSVSGSDSGSGSAASSGSDSGSGSAASSGSDSGSGSAASSGPSNDDPLMWTETVISRRLKQRKANKRHWRNK